MNWSKEEIEALTKIRNLHAALAEAYDELLKNSQQQTKPTTSTSPAVSSVLVTPAPRVVPKLAATKSAEPVLKLPKSEEKEGVHWDFGGESAKGIWEKSTDYSNPQYQELFKMIVTATRQPVYHDGTVYWLLQDGKTIARRTR
jgi:hypothetical protein